jgi:hemoglobin-like flavoprotein
MLRAVESLGRRHVAYGVTEAQFATVGAALLWTLEQGLGAAFTPEVADAWAAVYGLLATTMTDAMADAALPEAA